MTERMYTEQEVVQYMQQGVEAYKAGEALGFKQGAIEAAVVLTVVTAVVIAVKKYRAKKAEEIY